MIDNVYSEDNIDDKISLKVKNINDYEEIKNSEFLNSVFDLDGLNGDNIKKSGFSYVSKVIFIVGKPISYWLDTCSFDEKAQQLNCKTEIKELKKYGQILKINLHNANSGRVLGKKSFIMPFPDFFFNEFFNKFEVETEERFRITVAAEDIMAKYKEKINAYYQRLNNLKGKQ